MSVTESGGEMRDGVYTGVKYLWYAIGEVDSLNSLIQSFAEAGQLSAIVSIFMIPFQFTHDTPAGVTLHNDFVTIDGYNPKNNKLFNFPYTFLAVNNCEGQEHQYLYEYFTDPETQHFTINYSYNLAATAICRPDDYKGWADNWDEGLVQFNFPVCSWDGNIYANWLAINKMAISQNYLTAGIKAVDYAVAGGAAGGAAGAIGGAAVGLFNGVTAITEQMASVFQKSLVPTQLEGQAKCPVANVKWGRVGYMFKNYGIKAQFAERIDNYFTMFGYKVNAMKVPNVTGRKAFNYVKTIDVNIVGSIPVEHMVTIKTAFDNGITFWHGDWVGDYTKDNTLGTSSASHPAYFVSAETLTTGWGIIVKTNKALQTATTGVHNFAVKVNGTTVGIAAVARNSADVTKYDVALRDKAIAAGDIVTISYLGSDILAVDGTVLAGFNDENVVNKSTVGPAVFVSAFTSTNGWLVSFKCNKPMTPLSGIYSFPVKVNGVQVKISSITLNATDHKQYDIALTDAPINTGDIVTFSWVGNNTIYAEDGSVLSTFNDKAVTNNSLVGPATIVSAASSVNGWVVSATCSKIMKAVTDYTGLTVKINGAAVVIGWVNLNANNNTILDIGLGTAIRKDDLVTVSYNGKVIQTKDGGLLSPTKFDINVTNNSTVSDVTFVSAAVSANGWYITMKCSKVMKAMSNANIILQVNSKSVAIASMSLNPTGNAAYDLALVNQIVAGQTVYMVYNDSTILAADNSVLTTFQEYVTNNSTIVCAEFVSAEVIANGWGVEFKCSKPMKTTSQTSNLTVEINGVSVGVAYVRLYELDNTKFDLGLLTKAAKRGDIVTVSYSGWNILSIDNTVLLPFTDMPVTNNM
jgi:hypothetical protein